MEELIALTSLHIVKELTKLNSLSGGYAGDVDSNEDAIANCKKSIDALRTIRFQLETLITET